VAAHGHCPFGDPALLPADLKTRAYRRGDWKLIGPMVLFQPCFYFLLESNALCFTTSSQAGIISAFVPILVAVGAWMMLAEPLGRGTLLGLFLSVAGVAVLSLSGRPDAAAANPLLGNVPGAGCHGLRRGEHHHGQTAVRPL
jgi:drug/metabolite transporter (DMT)-like permease